MTLKSVCKKAWVPALLLLTACHTPKDIVYFQDITETDSVIGIDYDKSIVARPDDEIQIVVSSKDPELAAMFNLPVVTSMAGRGASQSYNQQVATMIVNSKGNIDFPILGELHVEGLTREQIGDMVKRELINRKLITDPVVSVAFVNIYYSVAGEVSRPGRFAIDRDRMTVIDALSKAGDLTIYGKRPLVKVLRREDGVLKTYNIDLTNAEQVTKSPAYIIQQDDVIYVEPNNTRMRQSQVNGNNILNYSFWVSIASVLTSMAVLIFK